MRFENQAEELYSKLEVEEKDGRLFYSKKKEVYPYLNKNGTVNWFNFLTGGKWSNVFIVIGIVVIALGVVWEYHYNLKECAEIMSQINLKNITLFP